MPRFSAFAGVRYSADAGRLDALVSPPYDVVSPSEREQLAARSELNAVRLELPVDEDGTDRYQVAARLWEEWRESGRLSTDPEPAFYVYRMGYHDEAGRPRQTTGVIGALELTPPGQGIVPHEHTTPKDKADRLSLLRACRANLSPIWVLTPGSGLSELCEPSGPPEARATDDEGVHHRLWRITRSATLEAVSELVGGDDVIVADGHHRYETGLTYQEERREATGGAPGAYDAIMACVVELSDEQLWVQAVHRLLSGLPDGTDLLGTLSEHFEILEAESMEPSRLPARMADAGAMALVTASGTWLLRPRPGSAADEDVDSRRLDVALKSFPEHAVTFQHGADRAVAEVRAGRAQAAVLLRPVTVAQIAATGEGGRLLPPKTTFFQPKLRTGMVFREVPG